ncbi:MAG: PAS domain-containing protein [Elusimicrobia bacterium]|nr:PAS domain-containing protein [Elusimicrobiota bacterium]
MTDDKELKLLWLNFLKAFTRALVQINLYKPDHPQVKITLDESHDLLGRVIADSPNNEFALTLDADKLIVNGLPLLTADRLPNSLKNIFSRFQVQTISFLNGVSRTDLLVFCQMQAFKGDARQYLKQNNVDKIRLSHAVYAKVDNVPGQTAINPAQQASGSGGDAAAAGQGGEVPAQKLDEKIAPQNFETAIGTLASRVTPDVQEQKRIAELVMKKFQAELQSQISKALGEVRREKKQVENDIIRTEAVISDIADGVVVVDKEGKILMMNPQAEALSGKALSELSGQKIFDVTQIEDQALSLAKEITSENQRDISKEVSRQGAPELAETIKKSTAIIQNEAGRIVGAVSIPTHKAKLQEVEQMQRDFMANMTHELRSPLTSIKAALEMLSKEAAGEGASKNILNTAIRNSERLNSIVTDILDFSKLRSGKLVFHQESVLSEELAREAADAMRAWANTKNLNLTVKAEPGAPAIFADRRRTVQILINLVSNSIKFTPAGGEIVISVDAGRDAPANFVFLSVKDTGCGIKKEDQAKIFEQFVQVAAGEKVGGTGLGLAITKAMVILQGGKLTLESDYGAGAMFRVAMPVYKGQLETPVFEQMPETKEEKPWWRRLLGK